jgi:hypothetical protein
MLGGCTLVTARGYGEQHVAEKGLGFRVNGEAVAEKFDGKEKPKHGSAQVDSATRSPDSKCRRKQHTSMLYAANRQRHF